MKIAVIGAGVVGLATSATLLEWGAEVTCYEAVGPMSQRSAGGSRIFRLAHAQPDLVDLAIEARRRYGDWEKLAGETLITQLGAVFCGGDIDVWAAAMHEAGARVETAFARHRLPVRRLDGDVIVDPQAGVIDTRRVGRILMHQVGPTVVRDRVRSLESSSDGVVVDSDAGTRSYDAVVVAAGSQTTALTAPLGIDVPTASAHHVRFTFDLDDASARPPCLVDRSESWRAGFTTYQHLSALGRWAIGAHLPHEMTSTDVDRDGFIRRSRELTVDYVRECLRGVADEPVEELYCDLVDGWGDGFAIRRCGNVVALHGDNLFKFAPVIGDALADAVLHGTTPRSFGLPTN